MSVEPHEIIISLLDVVIVDKTFRYRFILDDGTSDQKIVDLSYLKTALFDISDYISLDAMNQIVFFIDDHQQRLAEMAKRLKQ
jgi:hypothetical protein